MELNVNIVIQMFLNSLPPPSLKLPHNYFLFKSKATINYHDSKCRIKQ